MRALVVGANGFLGRALSDHLVDLGHEVSAVFHRATDNLSPRVADRMPIERVDSVTAHFDWVFLAAAKVPYGAYDRPDPELARTNVGLPLALCARFPEARLILASTVAVYGRPADPVREDSPIVGPSLYGLSKLAAEAVVRNHPSHAILRYSSLYGPAMAATLVRRFAAEAVSQRRITVYGDGSRVQDYLHVRDAAAVAVRAAEASANLVGLAARGASRSNREVAELLAKLVPGTRIARVEGEQGASWRIDPSATFARLNWRPSVGWETSIEELVAHVA